MSDAGVSPHESSQGRPVDLPLDLPLDFEAFYLTHQEFFHIFAELHLGTRATAEETVHQVFLEILTGWNSLLCEGDLEQRALSVLHRRVTARLERDGRDPAFVINGPISRALRAIKHEMEIAEGSSGLYEAIAQLPPRQFHVIVLRHLMGYPTCRIARFMGLDERTVDYHGRKGRERLRTQLGLPVTPKNARRDT
ncbi:sigma-70 family RNA polymerase sigma factor [Streptomyces tsukubensis]|uniref:sigma-70 family RNA polymerase sigma factor n=1 Tax=Streptomyces tsukubensis TaxID=83656 RepID=UPI003678C142